MYDKNDRHFAISKFWKDSCESLIEKNSQLIFKRGVIYSYMNSKIIQTLAFISPAKNLLIDAEIY